MLDVWRITCKLIHKSQVTSQVGKSLIAASDGSVLKPGPGPAQSPGSKARPELDFLGPNPSIGDGSGLKLGPGPARSPGSKARPGPVFLGPDPSIIAATMFGSGVEPSSLMMNQANFTKFPYLNFDLDNIIPHSFQE